VLELLLRNLGIPFRLLEKRPSLGTSNRSQTGVQLTSHRRKKKEEEEEKVSDLELLFTNLDTKTCKMYINLQRRCFAPNYATK
jgi:hypothetical protein